MAGEIPGDRNGNIKFLRIEIGQGTDLIHKVMDLKKKIEIAKSFPPYYFEVDRTTRCLPNEMVPRTYRLLPSIYNVNRARRAGDVIPVNYHDDNEPSERI